MDTNQSSEKPYKSERPDIWPWIAVIAVLGLIFYFIGFKPVYLTAVILGSLVWYLWGSRLVFDDGKVISVICVETGTLAPYIVGRRRWQHCTKENRPIMNFRTAEGRDIDVLKSYDPIANHATYPVGDEYSDIYIASIPEKYGELIDHLVNTTKENIDLTLGVDIMALEMSKENIRVFSDKLAETIYPKGKKAPEMKDIEEVKEVNDED